MVSQKKHLILGIVLLLISFIVSGCDLLYSPGDGTKTTPTPTTLPGGNLEQPEGLKNPCEGLTGTLEMQLLVGPSEAVGLTPITFATIPFTTISEGEVYLVQGNGPAEYYEDVLEADWGTYTVQFDGEMAISGTCVATEAPGMINFYIQMAEEQIVVIIVEGIETTYPWVGTPSVTASFSILDGAQQAGEGWNLILHLD